MLDNRLDKIKKDSKELSGEVREKMVGYIVTALGLVAGLAWNEAIKSLIELLPAKQNTIFAKFFYALLITVIIVLVSSYLLKIAKKKNQQ